MHIRWLSVVFIIGCLIAIAGCVSSDSAQTIGAACEQDFATLQHSNTISASCRNAIESLLPQPETNAKDRLLAWKDAAGTVYVSGLDAIGAPVATPTQVTLVGIANGVETTIDPALYAVSLPDPNAFTVAAVAAVDYSGSMRDADIDAAYDVLTDVYTVLAELPLTAGHIIFSSQVTEQAALTSDTTAFLNGLVRDDTYVRGATALFDAVGQGIADVSSASAKLKLVIVATDGLENSSAIHTSQQQLLNYANQENVMIIALGSLFSDVDVLRAMAESTGGAFIYAQEFIDMRDQAANIVESLRNAAQVDVSRVPAGYDAIRVEVAGMSAELPL